MKSLQTTEIDLYIIANPDNSLSLVQWTPSYTADADYYPTIMHKK